MVGEDGGSIQPDAPERLISGMTWHLCVSRPEALGKI
jgi:hypothetical protein